MIQLEKNIDIEYTNPDTKEYLQQAYKYWIEKGYKHLPHCKVYSITEKGNKAWAFVRVRNTNCHLSRFTVDRKGDGLGGKMLKALQGLHNSMTLYSNPEAVNFYLKHGLRKT